jgi:1-pyrroline-4-hydroxy-2-carboxylate deaminase
MRGTVLRKEVLVRGVIADVVVPYSGTEEPDLDRLATEVRLLEANGVDGLCLGNVLGGTMGATAAELSSLCAVMRRASRKSIFVILFSDASPEGLDMVRAVDEAGADLILAAQPHYLAQPGIEGLEEMFAAFRRATDLPLLVADCLPGSMLGVAPIRRLVEKRLVDGVLEGADIHALVDLLCLDLGVPVYSSVEDLHFSALVLGAYGMISNLATAFPRECITLYESVRDGDYANARKTHERLVRLWRALSFGTEHEARLRIALNAANRPVGAARSPYNKIPEQAIQQVRRVMEREGIFTVSS